jgi:L-malate glycosyltransferase
VTAVHQVIPSFAAHDAVSAHAVEVRHVLRGLGFSSEIYAGLAAGAGRDTVLPFDRFEREPPSPTDWVLYQMSTGSPVADVLQERPERKVVNYHNLTPPDLISGWSPALAAELALGRRQLREVAAGCELGIAVSRFNERELADAGFTRTAVAPVLVDLDHLVRDVDPQAEERLRQQKEGGGADLLFVGRIAPNKAQHDLVKALAAYRRAYDPEARLHLVGASSSAAYSDALTAYVHRLGLDGAVNVTGSVPSSILAAHYRTADVFVCLSEHEGFCVPLLEAMHNRVPIVAFAAAAVPETVGTSAILLDDKSPAVVAAAVHRAVIDSEVRQQLVAAGSQRLAGYTLDQARRRFTDALRGLLS